MAPTSHNIFAKVLFRIKGTVAFACNLCTVIMFSGRSSALDGVAAKYQPLVCFQEHEWQRAWIGNGELKIVSNFLSISRFALKIFHIFNSNNLHMF